VYGGGGDLPGDKAKAKEPDKIDDKGEKP